MNNNKTSQPAHEYDWNITKTIPYYSFMHDETIALIQAINPRPAKWLDTGCGTGTLAVKAAAALGDIAFVLADPSAAMLEIAKDKLAAAGSAKEPVFVVAGTEELSYEPEQFDVITAVLAHHYLDKEKRQRATETCCALLKPGGVYVTFETILPHCDQAIRVGLDRWREAQIKNGKDALAAKQHVTRYGQEVLPITIDEHMALLRASGFSVVEILWASGLQAGFYAIK